MPALTFNLKKSIVELLLQQVQKELQALEAAAKTSHQNAVNEEMKPDGKYDTRKIEASYLASAQAQRVTQLQNDCRALDQLAQHLTERPLTLIAIGALFECTENNKVTYFFMAPAAGGQKLTIDNKEISIITPNSPLGSEFMQLEQDEMAELETPSGVREYLVGRIL